MEGFDRRKFLKGSTVAAGLAGAMAVVPGALPALAKSTTNTAGSRTAGSRGVAVGGTGQDVESNADIKEPVVAHVRDVKKGEIDVFIGTRHFTLQDRALANRIMGAAS